MTCCFKQTHQAIGGVAQCGTINGSNYSGQRPGKITVDIAVKELLAIVLAAAAWGKHWQGRFFYLNQTTMLQYAI